MCSSVFGPATAPPLVTWPTRNTATPASFAKRWSRAAHSRTWPTLPGAPSRSGEYTVWMESTKSADGRLSAARASTVSSSVSPRNVTSPAGSARRSARMRTCAADSSPDTYSAPLPACWRRAATWRSRVLLPMPGSPPTSTTEPGTTPPPSTKSNSPRPVGQRVVSPDSTSRRRTGAAAAARCGGAPSRRRSARTRAAGSSASVFHAPHAGHCPCQRGDSLPQSVQKKAVFARAMAGD